MSSNILIVEDDLESAGLLQNLLLGEGYRAFMSHSVDEAKNIIIAESIDLVLLDINLSEISKNLTSSATFDHSGRTVGEEGFELAAWLRDTHRNIRIIFLTSRFDLNSKIRGLDIGGDDYIPKPFNAIELKARIRSTIRRIEGRAVEIEIFRDWKFHVARKELYHLSNETMSAIKLTFAEANVLSELLKARGSTVSRESLSKRALGRPLSPSDRAIDIAISKIRSKMSDNTGSQRQIIETVHGLGYKLNP